VSLFDRWFGQPMSIVAGNISLGAIGDQRLQLGLNHVCNQMMSKYGKIIVKLEPTVTRDKGTCSITAVTRKGIKKEVAQEIFNFTQELLKTEVVCQELLTSLLDILEKYEVNELLSKGKDDIRSIGAQINDRLGLSGMQYLAEASSLCSTKPGLLRTLEYAWNGVGHWRA
jgi:hypothetical protein